MAPDGSMDGGGNGIVDRKKRRFLIGATAAVGGVGVVAAAVPLGMSFWPSERAKAAGAPVEVDISKLEPGQKINVEWRGKVVWVINRTPVMLERPSQARSRSSRIPTRTIRSQPAVLQKREPLDQAGNLRRGRAFARTSDARRPIGRTSRLPTSGPNGWADFSVRATNRSSTSRPRVQGRTGADQPHHSAVQVPERHPDTGRRGCQVGLKSHAQATERSQVDAKNPELDRRPLSADCPVEVAGLGVLRAEEFQLLVLLRVAGAGRAGDADRHRHLPHHELQARRDQGVRVGRIHHARRGRRLVHPLRAFDRRIGVLHRRLPAHVPRAALRQLPQAARAAVDRRLLHLPRADGRSVLRLPASVGSDVVLGRAGDRQPVLDGADHRRRSGNRGSAATTRLRRDAQPLLRLPRRSPCRWCCCCWSPCT